MQCFGRVFTAARVQPGCLLLVLVRLWMELGKQHGSLLPGSTYEHKWLLLLAYLYMLGLKAFEGPLSWLLLRRQTQAHNDNNNTLLRRPRGRSWGGTSCCSASQFGT